ncbi:hypothetical protein TNCV_246891 [Trichonephila clavipes]|nr:hypothetical protein TNCV_246891 [Trichonephila clavipes]
MTQISLPESMVSGQTCGLIKITGWYVCEGSAIPAMTELTRFEQMHKEGPRSLVGSATCRDSSWICPARDPWLAEHCMKMTGMVEERLWPLAAQIVETHNNLRNLIGDDSQFIQRKHHRDQTKQSGYVVAFFEATNFAESHPGVGH